VGVTDPGHYRRAPDGWRVVITDVRGSTRAIEAGRYKDVNALGVASIVALKNALPGIAVPYAFGGDGATLLVPGARHEAVEAALRGVRRMAKQAFDLEMRAGMVAVGELRESGFDVHVARYRVSEHIDLAMFAGDGVQEAERRIKAADGQRFQVSADGPDHADFRGFECRWRPIPSRRGCVLSLMVHTRDAERHRAPEIYRRILAGIETTLAEAAPGRPVAPEVLELHDFGDAFEQEARIRARTRSGAHVWIRRRIAGLAASVGALLIRRAWNAPGFSGATYRDEVVAQTDFRKFDDTLRMVIDVTDEQRAAIVALLDREREAGHAAYGVHVSATSIMTCAIGDHHTDHVHFVDGADGGYALAARQLKAQLEEDRAPRRPLR
jgi:hypothetical protein